VDTGQLRRAVLRRGRLSATAVFPPGGGTATSVAEPPPRQAWLRKVGSRLL